MTEQSKWPQGPVGTQITEALDGAITARRHRRTAGVHESPDDRTSSGATTGVVSATRVGPATHQLVLALARQFGVATPEQVFTVGRQLLPAQGLAAPNRQALRAQVITRAALYFRQFARPGWKVRVDEPPESLTGAYEVVWQNDGRIEIDHLESTRLRPAGLQAARRRARARLEGGPTLHPGPITAVRVVVLMQPEHSFEVRS